jgi:mono/diheme cytochrome c family protein
MEKKIAAAIVAVLILGGYCLACTASSSSARPSQAQTAQPASATLPAGVSTAGQLADAGQPVYTRSCAKCHGDSGQGTLAPAIMGSKASLSQYNTGQGLLQFISTVMPADAPGTLSKTEYLQVVAYLLVQNNFVSAQSVLDANTLNSTVLKR